jgi:uncharacterized membrane protein YqjE
MNSHENIQSELPDTPIPELVTQVLADARELITLEVRLATEEARSELLQAKTAAIAGAAAFSLALLGLGTLLVALILALGGLALHALIVGGVLLVAAGGTAAYAYGCIPKKPLEKTRGRLKEDVARLKEHTA